VTGFIERQSGIRWPLAWLDRLEALLARELAPSSRKIRSAFRIATVVTVAIGLDASCHVNTQLGAVIVWLLAGAGPMMSLRKALTWQVAVMLALITSVLMARAFAETPWLILPYVFAWISLSTYLGATRKLGAGILVIQIVCLITFYGVIFSPEEIGWHAAASFDGSAIAFAVIVLFDNWLWPNPGEPILIESLRASVARARTLVLEASNIFLAGEGVHRSPVPAPTSDLPAHMALLGQATAEGASEQRRAILLAAITRAARIHLEVDREIRTMVAPELQAATDAIGDALEEIAQHLAARVIAGVDELRPAARARLNDAMETLTARMIEIRPAYIGKSSSKKNREFRGLHRFVGGVGKAPRAATG